MGCLYFYKNVTRRDATPAVCIIVLRQFSCIANDIIYVWEDHFAAVYILAYIICDWIGSAVVGQLWARISVECSTRVVSYSVVVVNTSIQIHYYYSGMLVNSDVWVLSSSSALLSLSLILPFSFKFLKPKIWKFQITGTRTEFGCHLHTGLLCLLDISRRW